MPDCCCSEWIGGLARAHAGRLAAIARREGMTATEALDVVQDAFHTLLVRPDLKTSDDAVRVMTTIVKNAARNARKKHARARAHLDDVVLASPELAPDEALAQTEALHALRGCMARLADVHRHVVTLRVLEELSGDEAARALGLTTNHVAVLLHRARRELATCMARST